MPRITADTVAEHARQQEAAVFEAAVRLFTEHGVEKVSLADIAAEVGLARNSIYRYFRDRNHLIVAWFDHEMAPLANACDQIVEGGGPPLDQLDSWVQLHLSYLRVPGHREMINAVASASDLSPETQAHISVGHERVYRPLKQVLLSLRPDLGEGGADIDLLASLVAAMVGAGSTAEAQDEVAEGEASESRLEKSLLSAIHGAVTKFEPAETN
ncbi:MAG: TetR/AcrR family transcriptional regulator [Microthrixaceae bacterium]